MIRKGFILPILILALVGESTYFARQCLVGFAIMRGEAASFRSDHGGTWIAYQKAILYGGDRVQIDLDLIQVLLFTLGQREAGLNSTLSLSDPTATAEAYRLIRRGIRKAPYRARYWASVSELFLHQARRERLSKPLDISQISENPTENLTEPEWWSVAALERAALLEPHDYVYPELIAEQFLSFGSGANAARACRHAVSLYPNLDGHFYLTRRGIAPEVVEAAVAGFEDALVAESLIPRVDIDIDAGRLLTWHHQDERAVPYLERATHRAPDLYDAQIEIGVVQVRLKQYKEALEHLKQAARISPADPHPYYYMGEVYTALGNPHAAIESYRQARIMGGGAVRFFHALGDALEKDGQLKEAERQFLAAANLNPEDPTAWSALAAFHVRRGDVRAAQRDCERLLGLKTDGDWAQAQCAKINGPRP